VARLIGNNFKFSRALVYFGWVFLAASMIMALGIILDLVTVEYFSINGTSGIRSVAAVAITGCLLAALGYMKEE
jgi:hypothetical protein